MLGAVFMPQHQCREMNLFGVFFRCETLEFAHFREREAPFGQSLRSVHRYLLAAMQKLFGFRELLCQGISAGKSGIAGNIARSTFKRRQADV